VRRAAPPAPAGSSAKGGLVLALYPRGELAKDADIPFGPPKTGEFSIGQLVAEPSRGRCVAGPGRTGRRDSHRAAPRSPVGDLLRLLPRPRRTSLGDHLEPADRRHHAVTIVGTSSPSPDCSGFRSCASAADFARAATRQHAECQRTQRTGRRAHILWTSVTGCSSLTAEPNWQADGRPPREEAGLQGRRAGEHDIGRLPTQIVSPSVVMWMRPRRQAPRIAH
jgi:hypothetical protein